jgi:hypothetical protein
MGFHRGQSLSLDFLMGFFLFLLTLGFFLILWGGLVDGYSDAARRQSSAMAALSLSDQLASSPGQPYNWTLSPSTASAIGFASSPGVLDWRRIAAAASLNYSQAKAALGTERDFLIKVESPGGTRYATLGSEPNATVHALEIWRAGLLNDTLVYVKVQMYD